jgi:hypothetical protein
MRPDALIVTIGAMLVPVIYSFRLHKVLLLEGTSAVVTRWIFVVIAILGLAIAGWTRDRAGLGLAIALLSPLAHSVVFRRAFRRFVRVVGREPVDVFYNSTPELGPDRAFAILFSLGCIVATLAAWIAICWGIAKQVSAPG